MDKKESKEIDKLIKIIDKFNKAMNTIMRILDSKFPDGDVDMYLLKRRINLCNATSEEMIISRCWNKIYEMRTHIVNRNEEYLLSPDTEAKAIAKYVKDDERKDYMINMIKTLKSLWPLSTTAEKEVVWNNLAILLSASAEYMLLKGYHT